MRQTKSETGQPPLGIGNPPLKLALETRPSPFQPFARPFVKLVHAMPWPAMLMSASGKIMTVNQGARLLMGEVDWRMSWGEERDLWRALQWPSVPFHHWNWKGMTLSVWDCALENAASTPNLIVRFFKEHGAVTTGQDAPAERDTSIRETIGQIVHEIKNPLTSLEWFATLLGREDHDPQERKELCDHLVRTIRSLDALAADLLVYSKPVQAEIREFGISKLLNEVEWLAIQPLRQKMITILRRVDFGLDQLCGDESLLKQALLNLILNAIHASPKGSQIELIGQRSFPSSPPDPMAKEHVRISIRDSGCGMSRGEIERMYDPFFSKRKGGTGLGLSIVKRIIEAHQGFIDVQSEQGKGTTVSLILPQ